MRNMIAGILLIVVVVIAIRLSNKEEKGYELTNYIVRTGDTLWSIAEKYAPDDMDIREYIYFIEEDNSIENKSIYPEMELKIRRYK
ncbi:MAG: LysM peptidoglycan-binding domain-containing protein [Clostridia bacterium]|nr:LysM peptidoglycan-binding domain-containing protein [Clostridia bacterium]